MLDNRLVVISVVLLILLPVGHATIGTVTASQETPTFVENDISGNTTWTPSDGPYRVVSSISVKKNAKLTIKPGTTVEFIDEVQVELKGDVRAAGTENNPIIMRSVGDGFYDFYTTSAILGEDRHANQLQFTNVQFKGGFDGFSLGSPRGNVTFHNVTSSRGGIRFNSRLSTGVPKMSITNSTFNSTSVGVRIKASRVSDVTIKRNKFRSVSGSAVTIRTSAKNSPIRNITISDNSIQKSGKSGIVITATTNTGAANFQAPIENVRIANNRVWRNANHGIFVRAKPRKDLGGVTASISATEVVANNVQSNRGTGIALRSLSTGNPGSIVARNVVLNHSTGVAIESVRTTVTRNAIGHNKLGFSIKGTSANVLNATRNNIYNNDVGMKSSGKANATNNYWGDESGPKHSANPEGSGNAVQADAGATDFLPFAVTPVENVPLSEPQTQSANNGNTGSADQNGGDDNSGTGSADQNGGEDNSDAGSADQNGVAAIEEIFRFSSSLSFGQILGGAIALAVILLVVKIAR